MKRLRLRKQKQRIDKKLFIAAILLVIIGLIAVLDASAPQSLNVFGDKFHLFKSQLVWSFVGFVALLVSSRVNYRFWQKLATPLFFFVLVSLVLVLIPGIGVKLLGARRWISIGSVFFQPSEFAKFGLILYLAKFMSKRVSSILYFLPLVLVSFLIMLEPDLGTTMVIVLTGAIQIFASQINLLHFGGLGVLGFLGVLGLIYISPYRRDRLLTYFQTASDPLGKSYHIRQILLGLGSGGLFGVGLGASRQKFLFLPEAATDSIFAVIAEEIGFIGALGLIFLLGFYVFRALRISKYAPDDFSRYLALGIASWIGIQTILNIASMTALVPLTGIPLPFISYGGSSLIMIMFATGILLNISKQ
ncbi:putative lipid II flippase FtsW [Candidatus Woesebacteria bacterium CG22_combo_CG10-13_8_21_14_all_39_10]|uniref:Probable peptidoglycan glycosyltransferase FtsW n=3 Tax=Candidatus Woeseibacteriota TaxID=1752722 RepID=A0A2M7AQ12_9BACT|nr:putative lipid II flippase FtsW [Candidatus Microgenomates bacterium]PIP57577.1 MAG: putative lipid II flippase FtsW [Candidatus Woesebacteria bacterium CG22_combo_CG10-13_8_21_14_all_39_10]PIU71737.1 MAG: putative lipid II flippase FtsW [Candidatus Woesebacteria bacterium CG06_land_8_20_14_3_00_39_27]PIZ50048.1 MAG: putative lipid II flippase FtsW [Candidatus Woesebacteria bacterium CG_4_10_14_0_2_um_filter_39_14]